MDCLLTCAEVGRALDKGRDEEELLGKGVDIRLYDCDCLFVCSCKFDKPLAEL
jgi:hypothetical protein